MCHMTGIIYSKTTVCMKRLSKTNKNKATLKKKLKILWKKTLLNNKKQRLSLLKLISRDLFNAEDQNL